MEEVCRFPELPARKPLTYQAKQLIAREIEMEKMRRAEALAWSGGGPQVSSLPGACTHYQRFGLKQPAPITLPFRWTRVPQGLQVCGQTVGIKE